MTSDEQRTEIKTLFRAVNDEIEGMVEALCLELPEFLCECGGDDCSQRIALTVSEYEAVRAEPTRFVVAPGHELAGDDEQVISSNRRYSVVETRTREAAPVRPRPAGRLTLCVI